MRLIKIKIPLIFILLSILIPNPVFADQEISVVVSRDIIPYHNAVAGVKKKMPGFRVEEYILGKDGDGEEEILKSLKKGTRDLILAVGPEAADLLKNLDALSPRVFTMVLNPEKIFAETPPFPGVSMNYPPSIILSLLKKSFPGRNKVGIFYSPALNSHLVKQFEQEGEKKGVTICHFPINSSAEIRSAFQAPQFDPDIVLFIPDQVIIKEKLINYIIEECLFRKVPTVGFNQWFARSGALMAFYLDYEEVGEQTGELALNILKTGRFEPRIESPKNLRIIINLKIARKFDLQVSEEIMAEANQVIE